MYKHPYDAVKEFHEVFNHPISKTPNIPNEARCKLRDDLLAEEYQEYLDARKDNDIVEIADALGDMIVIICGTALEYGIPLDKVFNEIHRSNMSKLGADNKPIYREDGKILKGPNYSPPNIESILQEAKNV